MNLSSLPENCVRVAGEIIRHVGAGIKHGPLHHRVPRHHVRHAAHHAHHASHATSWSKIVCTAVGAGIAGAGAAGLGYSAGQGLAQQFPDTPPVIVQPFAEGGFVGDQFTPLPAVELGSIIRLEDTILRPISDLAHPPVDVIAQETPPPPKAVVEPASAILLITFGLVGGAALAVSKKAAH